MTHDEMTKAVAGLDSKAEKIRTLHKAGASTSAISAFLNIRYQHSYNVLKRAGLVGETDLAGHTSSGEYFLIETKGDGGCRLPQAAFEAIGATAGEILICRTSPEGLIITTREAALEGLQEYLRQRAPEQAGLLAALLGHHRETVGHPTDYNPVTNHGEQE